MCMMHNLADYLLSPLSSKDLALKENLIALLEGRAMMITFGALCILCIDGAYFAATRHVFIALVLILSCLACAIGRIATTKNLNSRDASHYHTKTMFVVTGLCWAVLVGLTSSVCISTKQPSLMMLGACVVSALMFGALFMNASAPRFSIIQSTFFIVPPVLTCWLIDLEYKYFFVMQLPLWYGGAILITRKLYFSHKSNIDNQNQIVFLANHDQLTGLKNRSYLMKLIDHLHNDIKPFNFPYVLFLDLDGFKTINDKFGHNAGDELLKEVSLRLASRVHLDDCVVRLGGDEFVIVINSMDCSQLRVFAREIKILIKKPFVLSCGASVEIGVSIGGASLYLGDARRALEKADKLMYTAKSKRDDSIFIECKR
jgi:diguanylate cyclase (GGDEF)-like protein